MSKKLNYPLLGILLLLPLVGLLAALRMTGLLDITWLTVVGLPLALAAGGVVLGLVEHVSASRPAVERPRIKSRPIL